MKRIFSLLLVTLMVVSAVPAAFATLNENDYKAGTKVEYNAANNEIYTITVPAKLSPGDSGFVTIQGQWASYRTISVTADKTVTLTNSINPLDTKDLSVLFDGINMMGSNTQQLQQSQPISVNNISNAIFGVWNGKFNYNVDATGTFAEMGGEIIPEGAVYYVDVVSDGDMVHDTNFDQSRAYTAGMNFPDEVKKGDAYVFGDYVYVYGYVVERFQSNLWWSNNGLSEDTHWSCSVHGRSKTSYGEIQSTINTLPVTDMICGFYFCHSLVDLPTIPGTVKRTTSLCSSYDTNQLGYKSCALKSATFAEGVEEIGDGAFWNQVYLSDVTIPSSVRKIGSGAFRGCHSLTTITIPEGVEVIEGGAFVDCKNLTTVILPNTLKKIGPSAFEDCISLQNIIIPDSVTEIGYEAFKGCTNLQTVTIGSGIETIGSSAFTSCPNITTVTISNGNLKTVESNAFGSSTRITGVYIDDFNAWCQTNFGSFGNPVTFSHNLYVNNNPITGTLIIPSEIKKIGSYTFPYLTSINSIVLSEGVEEIGAGAFANNSSLINITLPESLTTIGDSAFSSDSGLTEVILPSNVKSIGYHAFYGCSNINDVYISDLKQYCELELGSDQANPFYWAETLYLNGTKISGDLVVPTGTKSICAYAFDGIKDITSVSLPEGLTNIETHAFYNCSNITNINIPISVTVIDVAAFDNCNKLETPIIIPSGVEKISAYAFAYCYKIPSVTIPKTVTQIDQYAFHYCSSLTDIYYEGTRREWQELTKGTDWNKNTNAYIVHCSDGNSCKSCSGGTATCTELAVCTTCGTPYGSLLAHNYIAVEDANWEEYTSSQHKKLAECYCGATSYIYESHTYIANEGATIEQYSTSQHRQNGTCKCGKEGYAYQSHQYEIKEGSEWVYKDDWNESIIKECICGDTTTSSRRHTELTPATCQTKAVCATCNHSYGSIGKCAGGQATCAAKAICSTCGNEYGEIGFCLTENGKCTVCGETLTVIETTHNPHPLNVSYEVLGTWDYSDAKSVNITITYQTYNQYVTGVLITKGLDYVSGSSYSQKRNYLGTNGTIINSTGSISNYQVVFGGNTKNTKTFTNVNMLTGSVIFSSYNNYPDYYGATVIITPNY